MLVEIMPPSQFLCKAIFASTGMHLGKTSVISGSITTIGVVEVFLCVIYIIEVPPYCCCKIFQKSNSTIYLT